MIYKAYRFDSIYNLKVFLNKNEIKPTDIIGIYGEQDRGYFDLLYVEYTESENKE